MCFDGIGLMLYLLLVPAYSDNSRILSYGCNLENKKNRKFENEINIYVCIKSGSPAKGG